MDIEKAFDVEIQRQTFRVVDDRIDDLRRKRARRIDGDTVAGVNAGAFDVLHDTGDYDVRPVGNRVHLDFGAFHVAVDQHRVIGRDFDRPAHVVAQLVLAVDDLHRTAAQDI